MFSFIRIFFFISLTNYSVYMHIYNVSAPIFTYIYMYVAITEINLSAHSISPLRTGLPACLSRVSIRPATARYRYVLRVFIV